MEQEGKGRFRPDDMGRRRLAAVPAGPGAQGQVMPHDGVTVARIELGVLRQVRLHDAQAHISARCARPRRGGARGRSRPWPTSKARRQRRRGPAFSSRPAGEQDRRRRADAEAQESQAVEADQRGGLHQPEVLAERHAGVVPGKAGEEVPAQPFADRQAEGEGEDAPGIGQPEQAGEGEAEGGKEGEQRPAGPARRRASPRRTGPPRPGRRRRATRARRRNSRSPRTSRGRPRI